MAAEVEVDAEALRALVRRSPLLTDAQVRRHWLRLIAHLPAAARYELAEILREFDTP
jgi:hypothetical protein